MSYDLMKTGRPRLYHAVDDPNALFPLPRDAMRRKILDNMKESCDEFMDAEPPVQVPQMDNSPFPFHNLYLCFYNAMHTQSIITQFSFMYLITRETRYAEMARRWVRALVGWDYRINTFYCSARVMHALAVAEDWLGDELTNEDIRKIHECNRNMCLFHEKEIEKLRGTNSAGGHSSLYTSQFGVAALTLLGIAPEAERWLDWAVERFEREILPYGVSADGTFSDGNWALSYAVHSRFLFMDALKNVTGIDLFAKYKDDVARCFDFIQYGYVGGSRIEPKQKYGPDENLLTGFWQLDSFSPWLLKLASVTRNPYAQWVATRDPNLGKILRTGTIVKNGSECTVGWGALAYIWYDPGVETIGVPQLPPSRLFPDSNYAVMRSSWQEPVMVIGYQGRKEATAGPQTFVIHWDGHPLLKDAPAPNSLPIKEGNAPAMAGEMELMGRVESMVSHETGDYIRSVGSLVTLEYALLKGSPPCAVIRSEWRRRKKEEAEIAGESGERFARLGAGGYLQYRREGNLDPDGGAVRMVFRLRAKPEQEKIPRMLFDVGHFYYYGNTFLLYLQDGKLTWHLRDHEVKCHEVKLETLQIESEAWVEAIAWWTGFNESGGQPRIGLRCGKLTCEKTIETRMISKPNTSIWVGSGVHFPDSAAMADIRCLEIYGKHHGADSGGTADRQSLLFAADYTQSLNAVQAAGSAQECAEGPFEFRMHPYQEAHVTRHRVELAHDNSRLRIVGIPEESVEFTLEPIPYVQSGYAGGSFIEKEERYSRLIARPAGDGNAMTMAMMPPNVKADQDKLAELLQKLETLREMEKGSL